MIKFTEYTPVMRIDLARSLPGRFHYWTTAYRIEDILIDSGCAHCAKELIELLSGKGLQLILNTHSHEDHIGSNGTLQKLYKLSILAHPKALPILAHPRSEQPLHPYRRFFWGWPEPSAAQPVADGEILEHKGYHLQALHTPGHCLDHICFYEPNREWLFSGDLFVGGRERAIRQGSNIWQIIQSLKRIADLPIRWLYAGAARARENPKAELNTKIAYLEELGDQILAFQRQGWSVSAITRRLCGQTMPIEWITLGHFTRKHLVLSFLGKYSA